MIKINFTNILIDTKIVSAISAEKPPIIKTRREEKIEKVRIEFQTLIIEEWHVAEFKLLMT